MCVITKSLALLSTGKYWIGQTICKTKAGLGRSADQSDTIASFGHHRIDCRSVGRYSDHCQVRCRSVGHDCRSVGRPSDLDSDRMAFGSGLGWIGPGLSLDRTRIGFERNGEQPIDDYRAGAPAMRGAGACPPPHHPPPRLSTAGGLAQIFLRRYKIPRSVLAHARLGCYMSASNRSRNSKLIGRLSLLEF